MAYNRVNLRNPLTWFAIGFGSGLFPFIPGTVGTLMAVFISLEHLQESLRNVNKYLGKNVRRAGILKTKKVWVEYASNNIPGVMKGISETGELSGENEKEIDKVISDCKKMFTAG